MQRLYIFLGLCLLLSSCTSSLNQAEKPHNFLIIVADDLGWSDLSCYGNTFIETPNLDALAKGGIQFMDAYAPASLCSPSRASIVTGLHPVAVNITEHIHGNRAPGPNIPLKTPFIDQALQLEFETTAEQVQQLGYQTAYFGKWHLGGAGNGPQQQGFQTSFAAGANGLPNTFFYPYFNWGIKDIQQVSKEGDYLTDVLTDQAIQYMLQTDTAFLMYLNFYSPHVPIEGPTALVEKYVAKAGGKEDGPIPNPHYAAMVESIDQNVGRIMDSLKTQGMLEHTTILFTSDNGGLSVQEVPAFAKHTPPTDNFPLKEGKGYLYEGGIRVPMILHSPYLKERGLQIRQPVSGTDIHYTVLDLLEQSTDKKDGVSLAQTATAEQADRSIYWHVPHYSPQRGKPASAVRKGNYKLIYFYENDQMRLYNLAKDPEEQNDLSTTETELANSLLSELQDWKQNMQANDPEPNPLFQEK